MPWDIQISNFNDLIFAVNRDFQMVTGEALMAQRIMLRLRMKRGSWILDDTKDLGSNLDTALQEGMQQAIDDMEGLVFEALEPINDEITIIEVQTTPNVHDTRAVDLFIKYANTVIPGQSQVPIPEASTLQMTIPIIT